MMLVTQLELGLESSPLTFPLTVHFPPSVVISQKTGTGTLGPEG